MPYPARRRPGPLRLLKYVYLVSIIVSFTSVPKDWQTLGGDFVLNQFYGVMGTRLAFGEGSRYKEVAQGWKSHEYGELDVRNDQS